MAGIPERAGDLTPRTGCSARYEGRPGTSFVCVWDWIGSRSLVESDAWFRLRWFLVGSLAAVLTAFALRARSTPVVAVTRPPPVTAVPRAVQVAQDTEGAKDAGSIARPSPSTGPMGAPKGPAPRAAGRSTSRGSAEPEAPPPPAALPAPTVPRAVSSKDMNDVQDALTWLRRNPTDGGARTRLERSIERAARTLPDASRVSVMRCVTQAGFEGRASVATERLARCVDRLKGGR